MTEQKNNWIIKMQTQSRRSTALSSELSHCDSVSSEIGTLRNLSKLIKQSSSTRFALNSSMLPKRRKYYILYSNHYYLRCSRKKKRKGSSLKTYVII